MVAMARTCERSLRIQSAIAGLAWALNNLLLGAYTAAALSVVSAGRTTTSVAVMRSGASLRRAVFIAFASLTLGIAVATWDAQLSLWITVASLLSTYAMFYMTGASLRWSMLVVSALWMEHAWSHGSWEQVAGNAVTGLAALYGAWRLSVSPLAGRRMRLWARISSRTPDRPPTVSAKAAEVSEPALGQDGNHATSESQDDWFAFPSAKLPRLSRKRLPGWGQRPPYVKLVHEGVLSSMARGPFEQRKATVLRLTKT
jgi:hypothetical protein